MSYTWKIMVRTGDGEDNYLKESDGSDMVIMELLTTLQYAVSEFDFAHTRKVTIEEFAAEGLP